MDALANGTGWRKYKLVTNVLATVLRHLRMGHGHPLEELGLAKAADELQNWRPDVPGAGGPEQPGFGAEEATEDQERY
jgi:hypothetical protein